MFLALSVAESITALNHLLASKTIKRVLECLARVAFVAPFLFTALFLIRFLAVGFLKLFGPPLLAYWLHLAAYRWYHPLNLKGQSVWVALAARQKSLSMGAEPALNHSEQLIWSVALGCESDWAKHTTCESLVLVSEKMPSANAFSVQINQVTDDLLRAIRKSLASPMSTRRGRGRIHRRY